MTNQVEDVAIDNASSGPTENDFALFDWGTAEEEANGQAAQEREEQAEDEEEENGCCWGPEEQKVAERHELGWAEIEWALGEPWQPRESEEREEERIEEREMMECFFCGWADGFWLSGEPGSSKEAERAGHWEESGGNEEPRPISAKFGT